MVLEFGRDLFEVISYEHFKLGKGNSEARIRLKLKDLRSGDATERVFQTSDHLPRAIVESREAQYIYEDSGLLYFMDSQTFEQMALSKKQLEDIVPYLKEGMIVEVLTRGETPVTVKMPITVDLKVVETGAGFKGDTASAATKPAKLETGVTIQVPLFVNSGGVVRVDTRTGLYVERVS